MKIRLVILAISLVFLIGGCAKGYTWPHSTSWIDGRSVRTYHYRNHSTTFVPGKRPVRTYSYGKKR